ncbi:MAG: methylated-DNA--[protein]-cysteine S-methyltransferase [Fuerstiella sp.]
MYFTWLEETPVGRLLLAGDDDTLHYVAFDDGNSRQRHDLPKSDWVRNDGPFREAVRQLKAYFAGRLTEFDLLVEGRGTDFQKKVWNALREVPYGQTTSYGQIAAAIGQPTASRAVGMANGRNPISIIVPCHRIIGSSGKLVGYGGGLDRKTKLLQLEGAV